MGVVDGCWITLRGIAFHAETHISDATLLIYCWML